MSIEDSDGTSWKSKKFRIFLAGPPGSGKGTLAARLAEQLNLLTISTGDLCRDEIARETEVGKRIKAQVEAGVIRMDTSCWLPALLSRLVSAPADGWLLDGAPRWREQVEDLAQVGVYPTVFIILDLSEEECLARLAQRLIHKPTGIIYNLQTNPPPSAEIREACTARIDDQSEKALARVRESNHWFKDIDQWYPKEIVHHIDASQSIDLVYIRVLEILNNHAKE